MREKKKSLMTVSVDHQREKKRIASLNLRNIKLHK